MCTPLFVVYHGGWPECPPLDGRTCCLPTLCQTASADLTLPRLPSQLPSPWASSRLFSTSASLFPSRRLLRLCPTLDATWKDFCVSVWLTSLVVVAVRSHSLRPRGRQHTRLCCPSLSPGVCSNSRPLNQWCHPTISSSVVPFSSCPQSLPASGSFPMSQLFPSGGQSIGASVSASVLPTNIQSWFPLGRTGLISLRSMGLSSANGTISFFFVSQWFSILYMYHQQMKEIEYFSPLMSGYWLLQERKLLSAVCLCWIQPHHRSFFFVRVQFYSGAECGRCRNITWTKGGKIVSLYIGFRSFFLSLTLLNPLRCRRSHGSLTSF